MYIVQDYSLLKRCLPGYMLGLLTRGKHLHDRIIALIRGGFNH